MARRLLHCAVLVVLSAAAVAAQDLAPRAEGAPDPEARVARRLLHAQGGGVLREESRRLDEHWQVKQAGQWVTLPDGMVAEVFSEAEVLEQWRQSKAAVRKDDADGRVALAEWGLQQGLYKEALQQLDQVLEADPDHAGARELLARDDLPFGIPREADPLDFAASAPPALRELAVQGLVTQARGADAAADADAELRAELEHRLFERQPGNREMAALALRRLAAGAEPAVSGFSEPELAELLRRSVRDVSPDVRRQAALALRDAHEEALLLPLLKALGSRSSAIRTHAAQTMAVMGHPRAVEPLIVRLLTLQPSGGDGYTAPRSNVFVGRQIAFVQDFDVEVAQGAAIANPQVGTLQEGATLDAGVLGVSGGGGSGGGYGYVQEGEALCASLERLTGANPGRTKADWQRWWNSHRAEWVVAQTDGG